MPRDPLGIRRVDERRPGRVGIRRGVSVLRARGIAFHGRQKSKWYLSFQQLIAASAPAMFSSARSRALSAALRSVAGDELPGDFAPAQTWRALPPLGDVRLVGGPGRAVDSAQELDLVELSGLLRAVSAGGGTLRNCDELWMKNGFTPPTHGVGSRIGSPVGGLISGCQCPTPVSGTHWDGPNRPSPALESSMALAAACPIGMPCLLKALLPIAASDAAYCVARAAQESRATGERRSFGCGRDEVGQDVVRSRCDGSVDRRLRSRTPLEQYTRCFFGPIALTAS